jgi:hypothetical protein
LETLGTDQTHRSGEDAAPVLSCQNATDGTCVDELH